MITFKQFLEESRSAPLYHGTPIEYIESIFKLGLQPRTLHSSSKIGNINNHIERWKNGDNEESENYAKGISLTRRFEFAKRWHGQYSIVIEFDQRRLAQRYKIIPFQYFQARGSARSPYEHSNEYEEYVVTTKPIPMSYVTRIYVPKMLMMRPEIDKIRQQYGSSFIVTY